VWKPATQAETLAVVPAARVVRKLNQQGASDVTFVMREGRTMTVARCFQDTTGQPLKFPGLLCVDK
jgi:eukaryotic translation initiation factor 2C